MLWIEAALAFAITMMILSTIVSVIIETGHRLFRIREKCLQRLIRRLYDDVIVPLQQSEHPGQGNAFTERMTRSSFATNEDVADRIINSAQLTSLSTSEFITRLAYTEEGRHLYQQNTTSDQHRLQTVVAYITERFDAIGHGASDYFKRRASLYSLLVGLLMAFSLNINAPQLFKVYLVEKDTRQQLVAQMAELDELLLSQSTSPELTYIREQISDLSSQQLPLGWQSAPWNQYQWQQSSWQEPYRLLALISWGLSIALSGLLIGLGGPFWFDMYRKLGLIAGLHKQDTPTVKEERYNGDLQEKWLTLFETTIRASQRHHEAMG